MERHTVPTVAMIVSLSSGCDAVKGVRVERGTDISVWFTKDKDGQLWYSVYNNEKWTAAGRSKGAAATLRRLRGKGYKVVRVGICDADMLGLESEVR